MNRLHYWILQGLECNFGWEEDSLQMEKEMLVDEQSESKRVG